MERFFKYKKRIEGSKTEQGEGSRSSTNFDARDSTEKLKREIALTNPTFETIAYDMKDFLGYRPREQKKPISIEEENEAFNQAGIIDNVIRMDDPTFNYNCHGLTFCHPDNSPSWIDLTTEQIRNFLETRKFTPTNDPKTGDIALYEDINTQQIVHSATIDNLYNDGIIIATRKLGQGSCIMHSVNDILELDGYGHKYTIYTPTNEDRYVCEKEKYTVPYL